MFKRATDNYFNSKKSRAIENFVVGFLLDCMSIEVGMQKCGSKAVTMLYSKILQLHSMRILELLLASRLDSE